jgi:hypothetical protein
MRQQISFENVYKIEREMNDRFTTYWIYHKNEDGRRELFGLFIDDDVDSIEFVDTDLRTKKPHSYAKDTMTKMLELLADGWISKDELAKQMDKKTSTISTMLSYVRENHNLELRPSSLDGRRKYYRIAS